MNSIKKRAFTLIELMIVVLLISVVYGIYFFTISKSAKEEKFTLLNIKKYLSLKSVDYGDKLTLICNDVGKICYVLDSKKEIVEEFDFDKNIKVFTLKKDEELEPTVYKNIELTKTIYFQPSLIFKQLSPSEFETLIFYTSDDKWVYINPYFNGTNEFINKEELISFIKKKDYLPMNAGLAK